MKKQLLLSLGFLLALGICYSQTDYQWLILDSRGKSSYTESTGENVFGNAISSRYLKLDSVAYPAIYTPPVMQKARNDVFIIYENGRYFCSRDKLSPTYDPNFFMSSTPSTLKTHNFTGPDGTKAAYMYLTNIYEGDDPPQKVRAMSTTTAGTSPNTLPYTTPMHIMTANQDVVMGKDITIILKNDGSIKVGDTLVANTLFVATTSILKDTFFTESKVFQGKTRSSNVTTDDKRNGNIILSGFSTNNPPYIYVNLRGTDQLRPYISDSKVHFRIGSTPGSPYISLDEAVLTSHDPNYIQVLYTCQKKNSEGKIEKFVRYHVEFENTGGNAGTDLEVKLVLAGYMKKKCISDVQFYLSGNPVTGGRVAKHPFHTIKFHYPEELTIPCCATEDATPCSGYVEFCVKVDPNIDLTDYNNTLEFNKAEVSFSHEKTEITMFEDLEEELGDEIADADADAIDLDDPGDARRPDPLTACTCSCEKL